MSLVLKANWSFPPLKVIAAIMPFNHKAPIIVTFFPLLSGREACALLPIKALAESRVIAILTPDSSTNTKLFTSNLRIISQNTCLSFFTCCCSVHLHETFFFASQFRVYLIQAGTAISSILTVPNY